MRVGLIARADSRGLGVQTKAFHDNMRPAKTMVVDCPSAKPLPLRRDWYPDATWIHGLPTAADFRVWLDGLTHVYTAETAYGRCFWDEAERAGVKTVLHVNPEFLDVHDRPTVWAAPSMWRYDTLPANKMHLPVPIEIKFRTSGARQARNFLHVIGRPATRDRNGTEDLLRALQHVTTSIRLTLTCQEPGYIEGLLHRFRVPANVELVVRSGDVADSADLYRGQDVLILPRRFGGLCLPQQEALGSGLPVVMPDISPNDRLPAEWLVPATPAGLFTVKQNLIDFYSVNHQALAAKIDQFAQDPEFFTTAQKNAQALAEGLSWTVLKPVYEKTLEVS